MFMMKRTLPVQLAPLALFAALLATAAAWAIAPPPMARWQGPNGMVVSAPRGWNLTPYRQPGGQGVRMDKPGGEISVVVYVGNLRGTPANEIAGMMRAVKATPLERKLSVSPDGRVAVYLDGKVRFGGRNGYASAVTEVGPRGVLAIFFGLPMSYHLNGREKMLPAILGPRGARLMTAAQSAAIPRLTGGSWRRLSAGAFADRVQNGTVVGTDSAGSGTSLTFKADGTYHLVYHHYSHHGMCRGHNSAQETGRYALQGSTLALQPAGHQGEVCGCCRPGQKGKAYSGRGGPVRRYSIRSVQGKVAGMILNGPCASWMTESHCKSRKTWDLHYVRR